MTTRTLKSALLAATAVIALTGAAGAQTNTIGIDSSLGSTGTLAITQDTSNPGNLVGSGVGTGSLAILGPWDNVSIDQQGANNAFKGTSVKANAASTTASLTANYAGGKNSHTVNMGGTTAPTNPLLTINVTNTGANPNTITDTLNGSAVSYALTINGTGNTLTNSVAASGAVALTQNITGSNNTVGNNVSGVASFTHNLGITGSNNIIANTANGGGAKTISQTLGGSGNLVTVGLTGAGPQSSSLTANSGTKVDYTQDSAAINSASVVGLNNVIGDAGAAATMILTQTALASNSTANVNVAGGGFTMGTVNGNIPTLPGSPQSNPGVYVYQNTPNATLNAIVTGNKNGYSAKFIQ